MSAETQVRAPAASGGAAEDAEDPELQVESEIELPDELAVGRGSVLLLYGSCFHRRAPVADLHLTVAGERHPVLAHAMPRNDVYARVGPIEPPGPPDPLPEPAIQMGSRPAARWVEPDPAHPAYRSGFWALLPLEARLAGRTVEVALSARLADGTTARRRLGTISILPAPSASGEPPAADDRPPLIAICMATFDPPLELFERQIDSIRAQTHGNWICLVSDDNSRPDRLTEMAAMLDGDARFRLVPSQRQRGFYRNFERVLSMVPPEARYVALADQDDRWDPDKLEVLLRELGPGTTLAYSDTRVVDRGGRLLAETYWDRRPNNHTDLGTLLLMNSITGAASLFPRALLDSVLPFPPRIGPNAYHDQWIGLVALARGRVAYVDRPTYDYVQHGEAVLGHEAGKVSERPPLRRRVAAAMFGWRELYFGEYCRLLVNARTLEMRCGAGMPARKRRRLRRVLSVASVRGRVWLAARSLLPRARTTTYGKDRRVLRGSAWPPTVRLLARLRPLRRLFDATLPPTIRDTLVPSLQEPYTLTDLRRKLTPLRLEPSGDEPARVNILIPAIDLRGMFAGYIGIFNLARALARRGLRVRLVCFEGSTAGLPGDWRRQVERYSGLDGLFEEVEIAFPPEVGRRLAVSDGDRFVATTWWSAHLANDALAAVDATRFLYMIQDFEPLFYPMGSAYAMASQSYELPHLALFSSELLRRFFRDRRLGVYADGAGGDDASASFENAITPVRPPTVDDLGRRERRRLLVYARAESYSPRNLLDLAVLALSRVAEAGALDGWEIHGVGSVAGIERIRLGSAAELEVLPRQAEGRYADMLLGHDVGLSLMYSPHPSLVPLEMASAGMVVVTNSFANKTPEALAEISPNLIAAPLSLDGLEATLRDALGRAGDLEARVRGSRLRWSRSWEDSFDGGASERIVSLLDAC